MPPLFAIDEHDVCVSHERGLYCLVRLDLFDDGENPLMDLIHVSHSILRFKLCAWESPLHQLSECVFYKALFTRTARSTQVDLNIGKYGHIWFRPTTKP